MVPAGRRGAADGVLMGQGSTSFGCGRLDRGGGEAEGWRDRQREIPEGRDDGSCPRPSDLSVPGRHRPGPSAPRMVPQTGTQVQWTPRGRT